MSLKERYLELWKKDMFQFQFWKGFFDADTWDYEAIKTTCEKLSHLNVGEIFKSGKIRFIVRSKSERFIVASTKSGKTYAIIDLKKGVQGPSDRMFLSTVFTKEEDAKKLLRDLEEGVSGLSYRNSIPVNHEITFIN